MKNLLILAILVVIVTITVSQGGGGRSSSSRSSSRSSYNRAKKRAEIDACKLKCSTDIGTDNAIKLNECFQVCDPPTNPYMIGGLVSLIGGVVSWFTYKGYTQRKKYFNTITEQHRVAIAQFEISRQEAEQRLNALLKGSWEIEFQQYGISYTSEEFTLNHSGSGDEKYLYKVDMKSTDKYGAWTGKGLLSFNPQGTRFWMMKDYSNKKQAGQTGKWEYLIYNGMLSSGEFRGDWYYDGFQGISSFSGNFIMRKVKQD